MCTLTWRQGEWGYEVYFNRDELRSRPAAFAPSLQLTRNTDSLPTAESSVAFLSPTDPVAGGTWIACNQTGITLCLLNGYLEAETDAAHSGRRSRGLLVRDLAGCTSRDLLPQLLAEQLARFRYSSFLLAVFAPNLSPEGWSWNGHALDPRQVSPPVVSSSWDQAGAEHYRRQIFNALTEAGDPQQLLAFQSSHAEQPSALTPCMHREDARTVSLTRVQVSNRKVSMEYAPGPPCQEMLGSPLSLSLQAS